MLTISVLPTQGNPRHLCDTPEFFLNSEYSAIAELEYVVHHVISVQTVLEMQAA